MEDRGKLHYTRSLKREVYGSFILGTLFIVMGIVLAWVMVSKDRLSDTFGGLTLCMSIVIGGLMVFFGALLILTTMYQTAIEVYENGFQYPSPSLEISKKDTMHYFPFDKVSRILIEKNHDEISYMRVYVEGKTIILSKKRAGDHYKEIGGEIEKAYTSYANRLEILAKIEIVDDISNFPDVKRKG